MKSLLSSPRIPEIRGSDALLDVRTIPVHSKHARIFLRWFELPVGGFFVLVNDHDPVPLRYQFETQFKGAFAWEYLRRGPDEFRVLITKLKAVSVPSAQVPARSSAPAAAPAVSNGEQSIDARGLEPPEPLIRILDALEALPAGLRLRAITDREPCHLFGEAEQRGFRHQCSEQPDGSWVTLLERA